MGTDGTDAASLKLGINSIFKEGGEIPINNYRTKLVSLTTDGASVYTGSISGLMKRMSDDNLVWFVKIHCINHRLELAVKDAFYDSVFKKVDSFYTNIYSLLQDSGKIKTTLCLA